MSSQTPPPELTTRAGGAHELYDDVGQGNRARIESLLPADWSFAGKSVLDFGCGTGRSLAVFAEHAEHAELVGCDLHAPSIAWAREHLSPPLKFILNGPDPPLDRPAASFDLVWGVSAFTHVTDNWAPWLLEIRRVLRPGGLAMFSFVGERMWPAVAGRALDPDHVGMAISMPHRPWDHGGPDVLHSEWWLRAHWGRAFEIVTVDHPQEGVHHGWIVLRRDERPAPTVADLEAPEPGEEREALAARTNAELLAGQLRQLYAYTAGMEHELDEQRRRYEQVVSSRSWTLTRPLRGLATRARRF